VVVIPISHTRIVDMVGGTQGRLRKRPCWMNHSVGGPPVRFVPGNILDLVQDVMELRESLTETELGWKDEDFLKNEVTDMEDVSKKSFISEEEEITVYLELRACAVVVEETIFDLMYGRNLYSGGPTMEEWKWDYYIEILQCVRSLSVTGCCPGDCDEEDE
jgi:hypothetical protein